MEKNIFKERKRSGHAPTYPLYLGRANAFRLSEKNRFLLRPRDVTLERVLFLIPPCSRVYKIYKKYKRTEDEFLENIMLSEMGKQYVPAEKGY